jgi:hypothetical protein
MYQFGTFKYLVQAEGVCRHNNSLHPAWGLRVARIDI